MKQTIRKFFGYDNQSKNEAKKRLKLLLIHDQLDLSSNQMEDMKREIVDVVRRYLVIEEEDADFRIDQFNERIALVTSLPVNRVLNRSS